MGKNGSADRRPDWLRLRRDRVEILAAVAFLFGLGCGLLGFWLKAPDELAWWQALPDALHSTLQLIALGVGAGETNGWLLGIARVLLPVSASLALLGLLGNSLAQWWLRVVRLRRRDHARVLIIGCGWIGAKMAAYYNAVGAQVVGVDRDPQGAHTGVFRSLGVPILEAEASAGSGALARAWPERAARVVICTGDDAANLHIAAGCLRLVSPPSTGAVRAASAAGDIAGKSRVLVCITEKSSTRAIDFDPVLARAHAAGELEFFDVAQTRARRLWTRAAPHLLHPGRFTAGRVNRCHLVFFGATATAEPFVLHAARALVYDPRESLRITVLGADAEQARQPFLLRHPMFAADPGSGAQAGADAGPGGDGGDAYDGQRPIARLEFAPSSHAQIEVDALRRAHREQPIDAIYVLGGDDVESRLMMIEALRGVDFLAADSGLVPAVVVCTRDAATATAPADAPSGAAVHFFELDTWAADVRRDGTPPDLPVPNDYNDHLARRIKDDYDNAPGAGRSVPWSRTADEERWWNRHAADHASIKLALLGLPAASGQADSDAQAARAAIDKHYDWLADLEHRRYVCERLVDGWLRRLPAGGQARRKLNHYRLNPTLVQAASSELPLDERKKDQRVVDGLMLAWEFNRK